MTHLKTKFSEQSTVTFVESNTLSDPSKLIKFISSPYSYLTARCTFQTHSEKSTCFMHDCVPLRTHVWSCVLLRTNAYYCVILCITEYCCVLPGNTLYYCVLPGCNTVYYSIIRKPNPMQQKSGTRIQRTQALFKTDLKSTECDSEHTVRYIEPHKMHFSNTIWKVPFA